MIFIYREWDAFCKELQAKGIHSVTARSVLSEQPQHRFLVLKHDVETDVQRAHQLAQIEAQYGHKGTYYVQAYLLKDKANIDLLQSMQGMGHEISYHYDVMDACHGDLDKALIEYAENVALFEVNGFPITTVCQHGNPVVKREGYTSNRDFFRSEKVQERYPTVADIMVDFPQKSHTEYLYFSDAGRRFKQIYDPLNNDVVPSEEKDVAYDHVRDILPLLEQASGIISTHPHRWYRSEAAYVINLYVFRAVKAAAKAAMKVPFLKRLMSKYYYLAKKI